MTEYPSSYLLPCARGLVRPDSSERFVVAVRDIAPDELVAVFGGTVLRTQELAALGSGASRYSLQIDEELYLVSTCDGPGDWINHSCDPNAGLRGQIGLVAMRRIRAGEEICFDYAMTDGSFYDEFDCGCGAAQCRGRVTGDDWKQPDLWSRYASYFSPYLERRISQLAGGLTRFREEPPRATGARKARGAQPMRRTPRPHAKSL